MKTIFLIILIGILVILFGTFPISLISKLFEWLGIAFNWVAKILNIFGWNGLI